jgi:hypothetical protein
MGVPLTTSTMALTIHDKTLTFPIFTKAKSEPRTVPSTTVTSERIMVKLKPSTIKLYQYFENIFPIFGHCADLKSNPQNFEQLRSNFKYRREFYVI